jgi:hypothetical protein
MSKLGRPAIPFWKKVAFDNVHLCWEWKAGKDSNGYGNHRHKGKATGAHRVSYELIISSIPEGLELDHLCRNRSCVNPYHLEPVTHKENTRRGLIKTHCVRGHPRTPENLTRNRCRECMRKFNRDAQRIRRNRSKV